MRTIRDKTRKPLSRTCPFPNVYSFCLRTLHWTGTFVCFKKQIKKTEFAFLPVSENSHQDPKPGCSPTLELQNPRLLTCSFLSAHLSLGTRNLVVILLLFNASDLPFSLYLLFSFLSCHDSHSVPPLTPHPLPLPLPFSFLCPFFLFSLRPTSRISWKILQLLTLWTPGFLFFSIHY